MGNAWIIPPLPIAAATSDSTGMGEPVYVGNDYAGVVWRSAAANCELRLDLGSDQALDTLMLFGIVGPRAAATMRARLATAAQGNFNGAHWAGNPQPLYAGEVMPTLGGGVAIWSAPAGAPAVARYVAITFASATAEPVQVGRAVVGKRIQLERNFGFGSAHGVRDLGTADFSARGVLLRRRGKKLRTLGLTFANIRKDEVEGVTGPLLERLGNTETVALVTDPGADAQRQNRSYFGLLVGDLGQVRRNAVAFEAKINLVSVL